MAEYQKMNLDSFGAALKEGRYQNVTGARRGIGKFHDWSEGDREKAKVMADKFFKVDGETATAKPAAKKPGPAKKTAMKGKRTPVVAAAEVKVAEGSFPGLNEESPKPKPKKMEMEKMELVADPWLAEKKGFAVSSTRCYGMAHEIIGIAAKVQEQIEYARKIDPNVDHVSVHKSAIHLLQMAANMINPSQEVTSMSSVAADGKLSMKTAVPTVAALKMPTIVKNKVAVSSNETVSVSTGDIKPSPINLGAPLSPEDQAIADRLRNAVPMSGLSSLPPPVAPQG